MTARIKRLSTAVLMAVVQVQIIQAQAVVVPLISGWVDWHSAIASSSLAAAAEQIQVAAMVVVVVTSDHLIILQLGLEVPECVEEVEAATSAEILAP